MTVLESWEIELMRETVEQSFSSLGTVYRRTPASDAYGGSASTGTAVYTNIKCYLSPSTGTTQQIAGRVLGREEYLLSVPAGTVLLVGDYVKINSESFEVLSVAATESDDIFVHATVGMTEGYGTE